LGCGVEPDAEPLGQTQSALNGQREYGSDCRPQDIAAVERSMHYGRIAASSQAFASCMTQAMTTGVTLHNGIQAGPYRQCNGDAYYDSPGTPHPLSEQIARAIDANRTWNDVHMNCTGGSGNASSSLLAYGNPNPEALAWGWLQPVVDSLSWPLCDGANGPSCRAASDPWPYDQAAGIVWHEGQHQQGYTQGANEQAPALAACGYAGDPTWNFQTNTEPYIAGNCIGDVIERSGAACGTLESCADPRAIRVISDYTSGSCTCISDPGWDRIGDAVGSDLSAVSWGTGRMDLFVNSPTNTVYHAWVDHSTQWRWDDLGGGATDGATDTPTAVTWGPNHLGVFIWGSDGYVWYRLWQAGPTWTPWRKLSDSRVTSRISAIPFTDANGITQIQLFAKGPWNEVVHWWSVDGGNTFAFDDLGGSIVEAPAAVTWADNGVGVFARTVDSRLWGRFWTGATWSGWRPIDGSLIASPPVAVPLVDASGGTAMHVFARATTNEVVHWWSADAGANFVFESLGGAIIETPAVAVRGPLQIDVFAQASDHRMWRITWDHGPSWSEWEALMNGDINTDRGPVVGTPAAVSFAPGHSSVLYRNTEKDGYGTVIGGAVYTRSF
jgi:sialidase-1